MRQDNKDDLFLVIGYDLRVVKSCSETTGSSIQESADPTIWISAREISPNTICTIYGVERLSDISNGLNLAIAPPPCSAPQCFIWAAFDAPREIVNYMSNSFGLQHSLEHESSVLSNKGFILLGYDVVDLWTQTSALFHFTELDINRLKLNQWRLFQERDSARQACIFANELCPTNAPFQPVGVWILRA
jgi:hypothetical protein